MSRSHRIHFFIYLLSYAAQQLATCKTVINGVVHWLGIKAEMGEKQQVLQTRCDCFEINFGGQFIFVLFTFLYGCGPNNNMCSPEYWKEEQFDLDIV